MDFTKTKTDLGQLIGDKKVIQKNDGTMDEALFNSYGTDRTKVYPPNYQVLVFPESTEDVAAIITYAYKNEIAVVPSGGRTGYAGGAVAKNGEIVVSLSKMNQVVDFDPFLGTLHVQAGMITKNLHKEAEERGFYFPVDFAATGSSQIGGNIATNAGGVRVVHYGLIRDWVLGLTVVNGKGEVYRFNGEILKITQDMTSNTCLLVRKEHSESSLKLLSNSQNLRKTFVSFSLLFPNTKIF